MSILRPILEGIPATLGVTCAAFVLAAVLGLPLVVARMSRLWLLRGVSRAYVDILRSVPVITWLFLVFYGLPTYHVVLNPFFAAVIGLGLVGGAYMCEIYRGAVLAVPRRQWEEAKAIGMMPAAIIRYIVAPQAIRIATPTATSYIIALLKDSAIASTIGVMDMTYHALTETQTTDKGLEIYVLAGVAYIVISAPFAAAARIADRRLRRSLAR